MSAHPSKIHPLVAVAAASVIVVSLVGTAAIMDWLPGSHSENGKTPESISATQPTDPTIAPATAPQAKQAPKLTSGAPVQHRKAPTPQEPAGIPHQQASQAMPPLAQATPVCEACGQIEGVRTVEVAAKPSGIGVVAGAVVGGLLGNQIGGGSGKTLATVGGAVGGGYAGNEIEKRTRKSVGYEVDVKMENGERRSFRYEAQPSWKAGDRVKVVDGQLAAR